MELVVVVVVRWEKARRWKAKVDVEIRILLMGFWGGLEVLLMTP